MTSLWLKFRMNDNTAVRINMAMVDSYLPIDENKCNSSVSIGQSCYQVKETCEQIDDAIVNAASSLRMVKGW